MGTQRSDGERSWGHVLDLGGRGGRCAVITALGGHQVLPFQAPGKTLVLGPQSLVLTFPFVTQAPYHVFCFTILFFSAGNEGFNPHLPGEDWRHCLEGSPVFISSLCLGKMPPDTGYTVVSVGHFLFAFPAIFHCSCWRMVAGTAINLRVCCLSRRGERLGRRVMGVLRSDWQRAFIRAIFGFFLCHGNSLES